MSVGHTERFIGSDEDTLECKGVAGDRRYSVLQPEREPERKITRSDGRDLGKRVASGVPGPSLPCAAKGATSIAQGCRSHGFDIVSRVNRARLCAEVTSEGLRHFDEQGGRGRIWIEGWHAGYWCLGPPREYCHMLISPSFRLASKATLSSESVMDRDDPTQDECRWRESDLVGMRPM